MLPQRTMAFLLLCAPALAHAHDLWIEPADEGLALRYGHRGGALQIIEPDKVRSVRCVETQGLREVRTETVFSPKEARLPGRCVSASVFYDGGFTSLTPEGEVNAPKNEVPHAVRSWASRQFAKWFDANSPASRDTVFGDALELVVITDLAKAQLGDKVTVRVLAAGKPVRGAVVALGHKTLGESDSAGEVRVRLRKPGLQTVSATLREALSTPQADTLVLEASLSFEVRP